MTQQLIQRYAVDVSAKRLGVGEQRQEGGFGSHHLAPLPTISQPANTQPLNRASSEDDVVSGYALLLREELE